MTAIPSTDSLRSLVLLSEKRDVLLSEIQKIEAEISNTLKSSSLGIGGKVLGSGHSTGNGRKVKKIKAGPESVAPVKARKSSKHSKRGAVKELILAGLKEAGEAGIAVKHLAAKLGIKPQNVHVWFHTTGKKSGLTEALGRGIYRLKESIGADTVQPSLKVPKPKVTEKTSRKPMRVKNTKLTK